jgi:hypothetical protein
MKYWYWAALDAKGKILAVGFTLSDEKFNRRCFPFAVATFEGWGNDGGRYCRLNIKFAPRKYLNKHISDVPHSRIRKSKDFFSLFMTI